ncbi:MAG TPA: nucleotidyltransferase family protein [Holophagaceae bacterium]|nr:nucleotidyltransferase family protein [Holophagaceae bacterium]
MIAAIVLAAGASRRLGQPKQLVALAGEALLRRAVRMALEAGCGAVIPVLPREHDRYLAVLEGLAVSPCINLQAEEGMGASIRAGAGALPAEAEGALLMTVDQVAVDAQLLRRLMAAWRQEPHRPAGCVYEGHVGIPALFPRSRFPGLRACKGDQGAKGLLGGALHVPFPRGGEDLDTPEDLRRLMR